MKRYAIVVEKGATNYGAYVPDLPGCVATGATVEETEQLLRGPSPYTSRACGRMGFPSGTIERG